MFVPVFGLQVDSTKCFQGSTLVIPCTSVGMTAHIATDIFVLNENATRLGFYDSDFVNAAIVNDGLTLAGQPTGQISMPAEFWQSADRKTTILSMKTSVTEMRGFSDELIAFTKQHGFANVVILTSTMSPVGRSRSSNRQLPELFGYINNFHYK